MRDGPARGGRRERSRLPAAQRRERIIAAATALVAERGFWGLSMQDVADDCGLTVPGLLHHVGSKDGLLVAVLEHRDAEDGRSLEAALGVPPEEAGLRELCAALVRRNAAQPEIVRLFAVLAAESLAPDHPAHDYFVARQRTVLDALADAAEGACADPEALARLVMATMDGLQLVWLRDPGTYDLVAMWEEAAAALFGASA
ncbi:TetR/AcrR family transcriptional regulator [Dactylosporangium sucinum]|uniref:TetR family transcriptional regulator n=1 Tax=Dactylosporangium sucinum TaxID=1424081 RepID=A0A917U7X2_9ACTN|nr:TetR/AcrR family transcriptional regulator [Dactylosporangium sucinum]GGM61397.1 TetR family transcriptional regulator [Dactylosporangium sucinum]